MRIAIIGCSKQKQMGVHYVEQLYVGKMFTKSKRLARLLKFDQIFVLSDKYGLVRLDEKVDSYEVSLAKMDRSSVLDWKARVRSQIDNLSQEFGCEVEITYFCGSRYYVGLPKGEMPFKGLGIGQILQWLNDEIDRIESLEWSESRPIAVLNPLGMSLLGELFPDGLVPIHSENSVVYDGEPFFMVDWLRLERDCRCELVTYLATVFKCLPGFIESGIEKYMGVPIRTLLVRAVCCKVYSEFDMEQWLK